MGEYATAVRAAQATKLERLGSDRGLIALTDADLSASAIRSHVAASDLAVADWFETAAAAESGDVAAAFTDTAALKRTHAERVAEPLEESPSAAVADTLVSALDSCTDTATRLGAGLVGYPLVVDGRYLQVVSFFVNEADESSADTFRVVRSETQELLERGESLLDGMDESAGDAAVEAALGLVDSAYQEYETTLAGMGLEPKSVC